MIKRTQIAALSLSAAALVGIALHEGYTDKAVIPVQGDRPTIGFGSTFDESGKPVQMGDTITAPKAIARTLAHIQKDERGIKTCVTAPLTQIEYDLMVDFAYQYGTKTLCASSIAKQANAGNYQASCEAYKKYRFGPNKYDCSTVINGKPNKVCWGVWQRSLKRYEDCLRGLL